MECVWGYRCGCETGEELGRLAEFGAAPRIAVDSPRDIFGIVVNIIGRLAELAPRFAAGTAHRAAVGVGAEGAHDSHNYQHLFDYWPGGVYIERRYRRFAPSRGRGRAVNVPRL